MKLFSVLVSVLSLGALSACASTAQHAKAPDMVFGRWQAMRGAEGKEKLCYIGTAPIEEKGTVKARSTQPYIMVTHRASGAMEVSVSSGYSYKNGSRVILVTDGDEHTLFFKGMTAWTRDGKQDQEMLSALLMADSVEVIGVAKSGATSTDSYSVDGLPAALNYLKQHCN